MAANVKTRGLAVAHVALLVGLMGCSAHALGGLRTCGPAPSSTGPDRGRVEMRVQLPTRVTSGTIADGQVIISAARPITFDSGLPVQVLILQGHRVVGGGASGAAVAGVGTRVNVRPGHPATFPASVVVRGCNGQQNVTNWPRNRPLLPAGSYQVVAVIEDHPIDRLGPADAQLVGTPAEISVVASG